MKRIALVLALAACGSPSLMPARCDFTADGVCVGNEARAALTVDRFRADLERALAYWGADASVVEGVSVRYETGPCPDAEGSRGCFIPTDRVLWLEVVDPSCPERSALVHEVGHLVIGDPGHVDPRWRNQAVAPRLCD